MPVIVSHIGEFARKYADDRWVENDLVELLRAAQSIRAEEVDFVALVISDFQTGQAPRMFSRGRS